MKRPFMKRLLIKTTAALVLLLLLWFTFAYFTTYSRGTRAGELIKISSKGVLFKTCEGEMSQGIAGAQIFSFSVLDSDAQVIDDLKLLQGQYVKVDYIERYSTLPWWGDSHYFVTKVTKEQSPFNTK